MKKYNFNAGPSILPREVIENTAKQILDFNGSGLSLAEISHRAKDFQPVVDEAVALIKELLKVPEGYSVLFLGGGASLEFCMIPYNFLIKKAGYLNTGTWAKKALKEAKLFGEAVEVASSADAGYTFYPKDYECPTDLDYLHITTNKKLRFIYTLTFIYFLYEVIIQLLSFNSNVIFTLSYVLLLSKELPSYNKYLSVLLYKQTILFSVIFIFNWNFRLRFTSAVLIRGILSSSFLIFLVFKVRMDG